MHVKVCDKIPSHCPKYALSDPSNTAFSCECDGNHNFACESCENIWNVLEKIQKAVLQSIPKDQRDEAEYLVDMATKNVFGWMAHIVRSHQQDLCRTELLQNLCEGEGLVIQDWSMNYLPRKFLDSQIDFFGKKGWPWCISVLYAKLEDIIQSHVFVHIFDQVEKGSDAALAIMRHVAEIIHKDCKEIKTLKYRSDNGNGYHAIKVINCIPAVTEGLDGLEISNYDFSAPQDGKGIADSKGAIFKTHASRYVNEGGRIQTTSQFKEALDSYNGIRGSSTYVCKLELNGTKQKGGESSKWSGPPIMSLHNFQFDCKEKSVAVHKAYQIGKGRNVKLHVPKKLGAKLKVLEGSQFKLTTPNSKYNKQRKNQQSDTSDGIFTCDVCNTSFDSYLDLSDHFSLGAHKGSISSRDKAKLLYANKLQLGQSSNVPKRKCSASKKAKKDHYNKGWALKKNAKKTIYSKEQIKFLTAKFMLGVHNKNNKANAADVAVEMRRIKKRGKPLFRKKDFLNKEQIKTYFSKLAKERKSKDDDQSE